MRSFALVALLALLAFAGGPVRAQEVGIEALTLTLNPEFPRPYETVTVQVSSTLLNLPANDITIYVDGVIVAENEQSATFQVKGSGVPTIVRVVTNGVDGR